ncbi:transcription factor GAGA-like [Nylanderia fulva]|uniref:transcription factor GAGA-like n=1 Tax=Nylanderia fulva TaxID=613905 RepID=UPI0010FB8DD9|nr:transcription factor GAGA-like [Nylanderia fulva]
MGSSSQLYSLSWGEFSSSLVSAVQLLRGHGDLVDVTLAAGGRSFPAHKIVLCAASPFLLDLLKSTPCKHPVVMLAGIGADDLESLLEFVYRGEVSVEPSQLPSLLQAAHCLCIHGLTPPTIVTESGEEVPASAIPTPNDGLAKATLNSYNPLKRRKKRRKSSTSSGKWPCTSNTTDTGESRLVDDNRTMPYENKDDDTTDQTDDTAGNHCLVGNYANNHQGGSHSPRLQESFIVDNHQGTHQDHISDGESHLQPLMPMQFSPLHIPQFHSSLGFPPALSLSTLTATQTGNAKTRGASDCPGVCPLCGATLRQARNLRRHLLSSCKYRFNPTTTAMAQSSDTTTMEIKSEIKSEIDLPAYNESSVTYGTDSGSNSCEQIVCKPSLPSPSLHGPENAVSPPSSIPSPTIEFDISGDGSKTRSLSDQPASCPLCGAILRQSRNLRRHLELLHFGLGNSGKSTIHARHRRPGTDRSSDLGLSSLACVRPTARIDSHLARSSEASDFSMMTPLSIASSVSSASSVSLPGNLIGPSSSLLGSNDQNGHPLSGSTPATCNASMVPSTNGIYSSDSGASMLSCLLPSLPTLPPFSASHDVFRHGEMLRAGIAYHDSSRQHVRHMQRTDVT